MNTCSQQFRDYLFQLLIDRRPSIEADERAFQLLIEDEFETISPHKTNPFAFFSFFFEREHQTSNSLFLPNGQKAFIDFFKQLPEFYSQPYKPIGFYLSEDKLTIEISHYNDPENDDYSLVVTSLNFKNLLVVLFREEIAISKRFLIKLLRNHSIAEQIILLRSIIEEIQFLNRIEQADEYDYVLKKSFNNFKKYASELIWGLMPAMPITEVPNKINEMEHNDNTRMMVLRNMFDRFKVSGRNVVRSKSDFQEIVDLFINHKYNSKVYFNCNGLEVGYILKKLFKYGFELNISESGKKECINNWNEKTNTYKPMSEAHLREVIKEKASPKKTITEIENFFSSIKFSSK